MKNALSVPVQRVDKRAAQFGVRSSRFSATATTRCLEELDQSSLTARINEALDLAGEDDDTAVAVAHSRGRAATIGQVIPFTERPVAVVACHGKDQT